MTTTSAPSSLDEILARFPNLAFTDRGRERLGEALGFITRLEEAGHEGAGEVRDKLLEQLAYLDGFGGTVSKNDVRRRFRVTLGADWALYSFAVTWEAYDAKLDDYRFSFEGGLIWHGGSNDPLCVTLDPSALWGIHT